MHKIIHIVLFCVSFFSLFLCWVILFLEKAMAPHSSTLAWKIPWTEEPDGPQSMGSLRVRHDWATSISLFTFMHWRRKWQPTSMFLPGESQERGSLAGCHLWGCTESDMTEVTYQQQLFIIVSDKPLYFCIVCCNLSFFISNFVDFIFLFFSWWVWLKACQYCLSFQQN